MSNKSRSAVLPESKKATPKIGNVGLLKNFRFYQAFLEISNLKLHSMIFIIVYFSNRLSQKLHRKGKRI